MFKRNQKMKILITGGTGLIGKKLCEELIKREHELVVLTRKNNQSNDKKMTYVVWNEENDIPDTVFNSLDGVINLMGENIGNKRWSEKQKKILYSSRVDRGQELILKLNQKVNNLKFFISSSAVGIYPKNTEQLLDESSPIDSDFLGNLCQKWEKITEGLSQNARIVIVRTAVVLSKDGGALKKMLPPFQLGLGGPLADGKHFMSWIHIDDLIEIYLNAVENEVISGIINGCSSNPVTNLNFTKSLGKVIKRPTIFPVPRFILNTLFGEMSSILLDSQKIQSKRIEQFKIKQQFPKIEDALRNLLS
jgi:uncharacterized protein (TIGR01777 family)